MAQHESHPVLVVQVVLETHRQLLVDVRVGPVRQRLEHQHQRQEEEGLLVRAHELDGAVGQVVHYVVRRRHVLLDAAHEHAHVGEQLAPLAPALALHRHRVVLANGRQHAQDFLVALDDKVAAPLLFVFALRHQLLGTAAVQVARSRAHHDGDLAEVFLHRHPRLVVDRPAHLDRQSALVR